MQTVLVLVAAGIFTIVGERDVRARHIPNELAIAVAILGLLRLLSADNWAAMTLTLASAAILFVIAFFLFWLGIIGGGDVKLLGAMALLIGHRDLFHFLFIMSLCGAALALVALVRSKTDLRLWPISRRQTLQSKVAVGVCDSPPDKLTVPYGAAIVAAGAIILILQATFPR